MPTKTLNIALDDQLIKEIDKAVKSDYGSRSEYFRKLALSDLRKRDEWNRLFDQANEQGSKLGFKSEEEINRIIEEYKDEKLSIS